jgi:hypothetical protein
MTQEYLSGLLRANPFVPFRVHTTDGRTWDVRCLGNALILRTYAALPVWGDDPVIPDRAEFVPLDRIARVEVPFATAGMPA